MNPRSINRMLLLLKSGLGAVLLAAGCFAVAPAFADDVQDAAYEIDGNAVTDTGDDADEVFGGTSSGSATSAKRDKVGDSSDDNFAGGGSKDERDVSGNGSNFWGHTMTSPPDKIDLEHAWASAYTVPNSVDSSKSDLIATFGATRFSNDGDAAVGFWFFKNAVSVAGNGKFSGVHSVGDVLITSDFRQGGSASVINVFKWVGGANPLTLLATSTPSSPAYAGGFVDPVTKAFCLGTVGNAKACAVANSVAVPVPESMRPYSFKGAGVVTQFPQGTFFEGGVNLTGLLGSDAACFSSFLAMSRTSASTTAQLKDFSLDSFPLCSFKVTKTCSGGSIVNGNSLRFPFTVQIENDGSGNLHSLDLAEDIQLGAGAGVTCQIAGATLTTGTPVPVATLLGPGEIIDVPVICTTTGVNGNPPTNKLSNTVTVRAKTSANATTFITRSDAVNDEDKCDIPTVTGIVVTKSCATPGIPTADVLPVSLVVDGGVLKAKVCVHIDVMNQGNENLSGVTVTDDKAGDVGGAPFTLIAQATKSYDVCYFANATDGGLIKPCDVNFSDTVAVQGKGVISGILKSDSDTATCKLCDNCN